MIEQVSYLRLGKDKLKVTLFKPEVATKKQAVLFLHGWTGRPNDRAARVLAEQGYICLTLVFRGHPGSSKEIHEISRADALEDAVAGYDFLKRNIDSITKICVVGSSYGGYTAALLTAERKINGLSLRVAANYPDEGFELPQLGKDSTDKNMMKWRTQALGPEATRSLKAVHNFGGEVQIFEAELDQDVPSQTLQNYADAVKDKSKLQYNFMKGWPHSLGDHPERNKQYQKMLLSWIAKLS